MLKKSIESYPYNFISELKNKNAILTAGDKTTGFNSLTISWGGIGTLWGKNVAFIFVRKSRYTYQFLLKSSSVTVSFLPEKYKNEVLYLGTHSGKDEDKIAKTGLCYTYDPDFDGAYIKQAQYCFKMKQLFCLELPYKELPAEVINQYYSSGDSHIFYICEIKQFLEKEEKE